VVLFGMLSLVAQFVYWSRTCQRPKSRARLKPEMPSALRTIFLTISQKLCWPMNQKLYRVVE
jgi:hypothetical protein